MATLAPLQCWKWGTRWINMYDQEPGWKESWAERVSGKKRGEKGRANQRKMKESAIVCPMQGIVNTFENENLDDGIPRMAKETTGAWGGKAGTMVNVNVDDIINIDHDTCEILILWGYGGAVVCGFYIKDSCLGARGSCSNMDPAVTKSPPVTFKQGRVDHGVYWRKGVIAWERMVLNKMKLKRAWFWNDPEGTRAEWANNAFKMRRREWARVAFFAHLRFNIAKQEVCVSKGWSMVWRQGRRGEQWDWAPLIIWGGMEDNVWDILCGCHSLSQGDPGGTTAILRVLTGFIFKALERMIIVWEVIPVSCGEGPPSRRAGLNFWENCPGMSAVRHQKMSKNKVRRERERKEADIEEAEQDAQSHDCASYHLLTSEPKNPLQTIDVPLNDQSSHYETYQCHHTFHSCWTVPKMFFSMWHYLPAYVC